jgi:hypothetical protein
VEEEAKDPDLVPEGEREPLREPVPVLDSLGLPVVVRTTDVVLDGEGEDVTVLALNVIDPVGVTLSLVVVEGLTVDVVLPDPLTLEEPLVDPETLGLPFADGLTDADSVSLVGEGLSVRREELEGTPVTVTQLAVGVLVVERTELIVCVRVRRRVRVDVLVERSPDGDTLVETVEETLGVRLTVVDSEGVLEFVVL